MEPDKCEYCLEADAVYFCPYGKYICEECAEELVYEIGYLDFDDNVFKKLGFERL
jgi:hypothetical protein